MRRIKGKYVLNPIMVYVIMILVVMAFSLILSLLGFDANYNKVNPATGELISTLVTTDSLFTINGLKYIFSNTVSNFVQFAPLSMLIITLIGIGIMEKSGFLKTFFTILTRNVKKNTVTFYLVLICILSSIIGDLSYIVFIPLSALLFLHGKRNPIVGIITAFASLTIGSGINILFTASDSSLLTLTLSGAHILDSSYSLGIWSWLFIMVVSVIAITILITYITEKIVAPTFGKYELNDSPTEVDTQIEDIEEEDKVIDIYEKRGLKFSLIAGGIYVLFILYNIIPGLPFSGILLDDSQTFYIDKLFSYDSFFSNGFVFIVAVLFVILGLFYGLGAKTIKSNHDFCDDLGHSLDGIGKTLVLILFASTFISIFKYTNIGTIIVAKIGNLIEMIPFSGLPLVITSLLLMVVAFIFVPSSTSCWQVMVASTLPTLMNAGLAPEFVQFMVRVASSIGITLTPLFAYFVIYLAYLQKYNQSDRPINIFTAIKYLLIYSLLAFGIYMIIIIAAYLIGLPIGLGGIVTL